MKQHDIELGGGSGGYTPQTFEQKVKSMTAKEIILSMVTALTHPPIIKVNMNTFGKVEKTTFLGITIKRTCYGCAATNTICEITGKKFTITNIGEREDRSKFIGSSYTFLKNFESAIDNLRRGDIEFYNRHAKLGKFAQIERRGVYLSCLTDSYINTNLIPYKTLADLQPQRVVNPVETV